MSTEPDSKFYDHFRYGSFYDSVDGEIQALKNQLDFRGVGKRKVVRVEKFVSYKMADNSFYVLHDGVDIGDAGSASVHVATPVCIDAIKHVRTFPELKHEYEPKHVRTFPELKHEYEPNVFVGVADAMEGVDLLISMKNVVY